MAVDRRGFLIEGATSLGSLTTMGMLRAAGRNPAAEPTAPASDVRRGSASRTGGPAEWRKEFPALDQQVNGHPLVYLDTAATAMRPREVIEAVADFYRHDNANPGGTLHTLARRANDRFIEARRTVAQFIGASDPLEVVFTRGTTEALNLAAASWGGANLKPKSVGLPDGRRRRAPGLRREEVAELAGIGVDWYIRLEQGRAVSPSVTTIDALARALRLSKVEHTHLRALASGANRRPFTRESVPAPLRNLVESLNQPAYITGRRWDLLCRMVPPPVRNRKRTASAFWACTAPLATGHAT